MFKPCILSLATLLLPLAASAVTFGQPDNGAHPYVGTLLTQFPDGFASCTGTMLSPTVMVTAAHCLQGGLATWVSFQERVSFDDRLPGEPILTYLGRSTRWIRGTAYVHPQYNGGVALTYDVGVVVLTRAVTLQQYGELPPLGFLDTIAGRRNERQNLFTVVGYGMQGYIQPFSSDVWERRQGTVRLIELNSTFNGGLHAKFTNNPGTKGGSCYGDSGGPVFYGRTNMITAVVSWGITPCIGVDYQFRLDIEAAQSFVRQYLPQ